MRRITVIKRKDTGRWAVRIETANHPAQRCDACNARLWVQGRKAESCPQCGGKLRDTEERRQQLDGSFARQKEAEAQKKALDKREGGTLPSKVTVHRYAEAWLATKQARVRFNTWASYNQKLRDWVLPKLGTMRLADLRPYHIAEVVDEVARVRSKRTAFHVYRVISAMLNDAVRQHEISVNVAMDAPPPVVPDPELATPPSNAQLDALEAVAKGTTWETPIMLVVALGVRRSEALGIRWSDVDFENGTVAIRRGLHREKGRGYVPLPPKSATSKRILPLPPDVLERLMAHRANRVRSIDPERDYVCSNRFGGPLDPNEFTRRTKVLLKRAGLDPRTRLHDTRHAVGTELTRLGVPLPTVSAILGHSSTAFTAKVYVHPDEQMLGATQVLADARRRQREEAASR